MAGYLPPSHIIHGKNSLQKCYMAMTRLIEPGSSTQNGVAALVHPALPSPRVEAAAVTVLAPVPLSSQTPPAPQHIEHTAKSFTNGNGNGCASNGVDMQVKATNGASAATGFPSVQGAGHGGNNGGDEQAGT